MAQESEMLKSERECDRKEEAIRDRERKRLCLSYNVLLLFVQKK